MGYSYERTYTGHMALCCDICGKSGGVRRRKCPFGYCQAVAACSECYKAKTTELRHYHVTNECEKKHNAFVADEKKRADLITSGVPVRCSALQFTPPIDKVHVLFQSKDATIGFFMSHATYDAIELGVPATPDDYRKHGTLEPAPDDYYKPGGAGKS